MKEQNTHGNRQVRQRHPDLPGSDKPSVDKLNIDIEDGEFLVLVGPSGCGKSTSLRMLAGLEEVNGGKIWIGDRDVTDPLAKDRDVAMVFQNYALYPTCPSPTTWASRSRSPAPTRPRSASASRRYAKIL